MMPFSSVAIIEKLALLKIAFCRAPVFSRVSWRRTSVMPSGVRVLALITAADVVFLAVLYVAEQAIEFAFDHFVALANVGIQQRTVQHRDVAAAITDHAQILQF